MTKLVRWQDAQMVHNNTRNGDTGYQKEADDCMSPYATFIYNKHNKTIIYFIISVYDGWFVV